MHSRTSGEIPPVPIDEIDRKIIAALHQNGRISYTDLAKEIGLSRVAVQARINALMESGVIERFTAVINPEKIGIHVSAFFQRGGRTEASARCCRAVGVGAGRHKPLSHDRTEQASHARFVYEQSGDGDVFEGKAL